MKKLEEESMVGHRKQWRKARKSKSVHGGCPRPGEKEARGANVVRQGEKKG